MVRNPISNNKIASNFKKLRAQKGYSQEKVARLADLSLNTIIRIESGINKNPKADTSNLEKQIDQLVYKLYGLTPEEIKIVESSTRL